MTADHAAPGGTSLPGPQLEGRAGEYFGYHALDELRVQRCAACGRWMHPPRANCPDCAGSVLEWTPVSGQGELYTWTVTHHAFSAEFSHELPYAGGIVALDEGVRVFAMLRRVAPEQLSPGLRLRACFEPRRGDSKIVVFEPDDR